MNLLGEVAPTAGFFGLGGALIDDGRSLLTEPPLECGGGDETSDTMTISAEDTTEVGTVSAEAPEVKAFGGISKVNSINGNTCFNF